MTPTAATAFDHPRIERELHAALQRRLLAILPRAVTVSALVALLLAAILRPVAGTLPTLVWLGAFLLVSALRLHLFRRARRVQLLSQEEERLLLAGTFVAGCIWGAAIELLLPAHLNVGIATAQAPHLISHIFVLALALAGVAAGAVVTSAYLLPHVHAFILPTLLPFAVTLLLSGDDGLMVGGLLALLFLFLLLSAARYFHHTLAQSCRTQLQLQQAVEQNIADRKFLHLVLDTIPARVFWKDASLRYLGCNRAFANDAGFSSPDEIVGKRDGDLRWNLRASEFASEESQVLLSLREIQSQQELSILPDGQRRWLEKHKRPILNDDGIAIGILGAYTDISERKHAEESLQLAATAFETHEAVAILDASATIRSVNKACATVTGYASKEVVGQSAERLLAAPLDPISLQRHLRTLRHAGKLEANLSLQRKDGVDFPAELHISAILDANGAPAHYVAIFSDRSEQLRREEQQRIAQRMAAVASLAGGMAHEFNNILLGLTGNLYLARERVSDGDPETAHLLDETDALGFRIAEVVQQLQTLASSNRDTLKLLPLDLEQWLHSCLKLLRDTIPSGIELKLAAHAADLPIEADATLLQQILFHLLANARDGCQQRRAPKIVISLGEGTASGEFRLRHPDFGGYRHVSLTVSDNGVGIAEELLERVFDPFFSTKEIGKGIGLGLSVVKGAMNSMKGCVELNSTQGVGTSVTLYFPRSNALKSAATVTASISLHGNGETILIAEDDPMLLQIIPRLLEEHGYRTLVAANGDEAVQLFRTHADTIDLLLFDVVMPICTGIEAVQQIRALRPDIPVLFTSGYSQTDMVEEISALENCTMIGKPFRIDIFGRALALLLSARNNRT